MTEGSSSFGGGGRFLGWGIVAIKGVRESKAVKEAIELYIQKEMPLVKTLDQIR